MRVHLIKEKTIRNYVLANSGSNIPFLEWIAKLKKADWNNPSDIKKTFSTADITGKGNNRLIFDIGGNNYRMICKYAFGTTEVHLFVCWIGTHAEYDKLCAAKLQYSINVY